MKRLALLFALVVFGASIAFAAGQGEDDSYTIRLGHIRDTEHPTHLGALEFKRIVEEESDGRITVNVFPNSQLGGIQEMFAQIATGDLEMVYGGINTYGFIEGGDAFEITAIPFLYRDYEHMLSALQADFFEPVFEDAEERTGIRVMNIGGDTAPRGLTANRAIRGPEDFEGLRIRTAASEVVLRAMQGLGALPQQIPFAELYVALRTGVVDAQENGAIVVANASLYEVQDYYMKTDYIRDIETFYANPAWHDGLSRSDRNLLMRASDAAGELVTELTAEQLDSAYDLLEDNMTVIRPPELDLDAIRAELEGTYEDWDGTKWPEGLLAEIRDM
jgi:TRAP-type transport system periplasmic protein